MRAYIKDIYLFNDEEEYRHLELKEGLNIISGDSKTGKSAIIEIIDYCMFAKNSTIPKGIITDWTYLYCVIIKLPTKYFILGRKKKSDRVFFSVETDEKFLISFSKKYFDDERLFRPVKESQLNFEKHIGLSVEDTRADDDDSKIDGGSKASMRSFASFLFQHQNLIANKHSLFYRFDDYRKQKKTIEDYPILMGWENSEFFMIRRELNEKKKELDKQKKLAEKLRLQNTEFQYELRRILGYYFIYIGLQTPQKLNTEELLNLSENLPFPTITSQSDNSINKQLNYIRESIRVESGFLEEVKIKLSKLERLLDVSQNHSANLLRLKALATVNGGTLESCKCPLCSTEIPEINSKLLILNNSQEHLLEEIQKVHIYANDYTKQYEELRKERDRYKRKIKELTTEERLLLEQLKQFEKQRGYYENALIMKGRTEAHVESLKQRNKLLDLSVDVDILALQEQINILTERLSGFNLAEKLKSAEVKLSEKMTEICSQLDFEEEFKPGKIFFNLEDFVLKYNYKNTNITLSEMGSGSNWLAIHLSTSLSFLYLHSTENSCLIPSFLVLDQPSQVYFPKSYRQSESEDNNGIDDNVTQVKNFFDVIIKTIEKIEIEKGYQPQVIVLEHADEPELDSYMRYRWAKDGKKLI